MFPTKNFEQLVIKELLIFLGTSNIPSNFARNLQSHADFVLKLRVRYVPGLKAV